ncbi:MAG TPA: threonine/serine exporter family protein [Clostridiaceae bacterium]|nr:threonine/serine exporter family protein [Clostridiaceae bacterium]
MAKKQNYINEIVQLAAQVGTGLLTSGAETYRAEESMESILASYGDCINNVHVFAITHYLTISADDREGDTVVITRTIRSAETNLNKVALLNNITRKICEEAPDPVRAREEVNEILETPRYPQLIYTAAVALTGFSFTLLLGASLVPSLWAAVASTILMFIVEPLQKLGGNRIFINIIRGVLIYLMVFPVLFTEYSDQLHLMIAGSFMYLFPGIMLVNSIRDLIASDYLAGLIKIIETLLAASALAVGTGITSAIMSYIFSVEQSSLKPLNYIDPRKPISFLIATAAVFAFMVIFDVRNKLPLFVGSVGGGISWLIYALTSYLGKFNYALPILLAIIFLATYAELMARVTKKPATVYLTAGLYPLVPGYDIYRTMMHFLSGQYSEFMSSFMRTLMITGTLALGIMLVSSIPKLLYNRQRTDKENIISR